MQQLDLLPGQNRAWRPSFIAIAAKKFTACVLAAASVTAIAGCFDNPTPPPKNVTPWPTRPPKADVPEFMKGTIWEKTDTENTDPYLTSGYGLVVNLHGTANNNNMPNVVHDYIVKQMTIHQVGSPNSDGPNISPEDMLKSRDVAVVEVDGYIPVGARRGQRFDVMVSAVRGTSTTSLAHGDLYRTDLKKDGAASPAAGTAMEASAQEGQVFVNPAYALKDLKVGSTVPASLRTGVVLGSGRVDMDRPVHLLLRQPQFSTSRSMQMRLIERFQLFTVPKVAVAIDDGLIELYVPDEFAGDWQHFVGVATHCYIESSPEFTAIKAQQLVAAAQLKDAPLADISYCWEGLADNAIPIYAPLMASVHPDIAYAAARAAACVGDPAAQHALVDIAHTPGHPFQLLAVQTLGSLKQSDWIDHELRQLLSSDQTLARLEAYRILAKHHDGRILTKVINERFLLDIVESDGPPLIYASRQGLPRIAIFGSKTSLSVPVMFSAFNNQLTIASSQSSDLITMFYRGPGTPPIEIFSTTNLPIVVARLGGQAPKEEAKLSFSYGDIVAMLQSMVDDHKVIGFSHNAPAPVAFVLQDVSSSRDSIYAAPAIPEGARPQSASSAVPDQKNPAGSTANATAAPLAN